MIKTAASWILVLLVPLAGCSTYDGEKLDVEGNLGDAGDAGIPYVMTRPEYALTRDDSATPARYTVKVAYVPDPAQRYTLRLSPALTSAVTFDMDLGTDGELASVSNKLTDQIVPTFKALFSFVLSTFGTVAKVASVGIRDTSSLTTQRLMCLDEKTDARQSYCAIGEFISGGCSTEAVISLQMRILTDFFNPSSEAAISQTEVRPDRGEIFATLHYLNSAEQVCLRTGASGMANVEDVAAKVLKKTLDDSLPDAAASSADDAKARALFKGRLKAIIDHADVSGGRRLIQAVKAGLEASTGDDRLVLLRRELGAANVVVSEDELRKWQATLETMLMWERNPLAILNADLPDDYSNPDRIHFKAVIERIVRGRDRQTLANAVKLLGESMESAEGPERAELVRWQQAVDAMHIVGTDPDSWNRLPAAPIELLARAKRVSAGLQAVADLDADKWRGRHIAYLDQQIERQALKDMSGGSFTDPVADEEILKWRREIAVTAYKSTEYDRLGKVETLLLDKIPPDSAPRISPFEEYGRARAEAERLRTEIAQAAEALVAGARSAPAAARPLPLFVAQVPASCIRESVEGGPSWYFGQGATAPEFVIVLERPGAGPKEAPKKDPQKQPQEHSNDEAPCRWTELQQSSS